ncbi:hypothetical protein MMC07_009378 [Pseudocyphellaria aurata]|nr:hypothetical protein [Pseudocyphellaria aurata]
MPDAGMMASSSTSTSILGKSSRVVEEEETVNQRNAVKQRPTSHSTKPHNRRKPRNWSELKRTLAQPQRFPFLSKFSTDAFEAFKRAQDDPCSKTTVMSILFPFTGPEEIPIRDLPSGDSQPVTHDIRPEPQSDFYDGADPAHIDHRILDALPSCIIPFGRDDAPALPNYFLTVRGPTERRSAALTRAFHDGIIGARAIHELRSCHDGDRFTPPLHDHRAYTLTACLDRARLTLYAVHPHHHHHPSSAARRPHYELHRLLDTDLAASRPEFDCGVTALRNGLDWARARRGDLVTTANVRALGMPGEVFMDGTVMDDATEPEFAATEPEF